MNMVGERVQFISVKLVQNVAKHDQIGLPAGPAFGHRNLPQRYITAMCQPPPCELQRGGCQIKAQKTIASQTKRRAQGADRASHFDCAGVARPRQTGDQGRVPDLFASVRACVKGGDEMSVARFVHAGSRKWGYGIVGPVSEPDVVFHCAGGAVAMLRSGVRHLMQFTAVSTS